MFFPVHVTGVTKPLWFEFTGKPEEDAETNYTTVTAVEVKQAVADAKVSQIRLGFPLYSCLAAHVLMF